MGLYKSGALSLLPESCYRPEENHKAKKENQNPGNEIQIHTGFENG
jgi:hypothetical protein